MLPPQQVGELKALCSIVHELSEKVGLWQVAERFFSRGLVQLVITAGVYFELRSLHVLDGDSLVENLSSSCRSEGCIVYDIMYLDCRLKL